MAEPVKEAPVKRKPELELVDEVDNPKKIKPEVSGNDPPLIEEKSSKDDSEAEANGENDEDDDDDDDDEDDEIVDENGEHSNGKSVIDSKGKGIMVEDKGKGKLKVENRSEDDSSDDGNPSDEDTDLSDDPLAEVDLENIIPLRTRRRVAQPGAYIVNDPDGDDDSDDSDA
ncbi:histone H2A.Z-specific chaperone CHZ1-like isoform X2 [Telopea speciosissima]|uniref:histone H2A.Z-specific chaperone CHZ1-like isoform X2 n=1 Tax=Telopea speciosissima TaxID=54955 RepID=UPI001CC6AB2E|nr:histone H2A.Z-specific chaperone CHZ1-like isoform X2 [Telopea speciosissima]